MDWPERLMVGFLVVCGIGLVFSIIGAVFSARVEAHCLRLGWSGGRVDATLTGYCGARIEQTDVVVPWREAKRR